MNHFDGSCVNLRKMKRMEIMDYILDRSKKRQLFYEIALKMFAICESRGVRLVVENPYSPLHYLNYNFPFKPAVIDKNRQLRGDYFRKPTQYWFVNCQPTEGFTEQTPKEVKVVKQLSGHTGSLCDEDRSMISPDYARNFICDFILGRKQPDICPTLF